MQLIKYALLIATLISLPAFAATLSVKNMTPIKVRVLVHCIWPAPDTNTVVDAWSTVSTGAWGVFTKLRVLYEGDPYISQNGTHVSKGYELVWLFPTGNLQSIPQSLLLLTKPVTCQYHGSKKRKIF